MLFRKNKTKQNKTSNIAETPKDIQIEREKPSTIKVLFFIWNILSIVLYSSYTLFVIYKLSEKNFLSKIIIYLLIAYVVAFLILLIISIGNHTKLKYRLKNFQSATKFFKYFIQIINFSLSIFTAISAFITNGTTDFSSLLYAVLSLIITFIFIFFEIVKIIIRKNIPLIKQNFLEIRDHTVHEQKKDNANEK